MIVRQALRVGMVTVGVAAVWPTALAWAPTATPAPAVVLADAARVEPTATAHPPVPRDLGSLWLVPDARPVPPLLLKNFTRAIELVEAESLDEARPFLAAPALAKTPVAEYARYYTALIDLRRAKRPARARRSTRLSRRDRPACSVNGRSSAKRWRRSRPAISRPPRCSTRRCRRTSRKSPTPCCSDWRGRWRPAETASGRSSAYRDLYYGYPMSDVAAEARTQMIALGAAAATDDTRELARAEQLFTARRYADAQAAFAALPARSGDDRELVALRIAECDHYLGGTGRPSRLQPFLSGAKREAEARFFHLSSTRALGDHAGYAAAATRARLRLQDGRVDGRDPEQPGHALHRHDDDATAGAVFADYRAFPQGKYGARAAWRLGWWKYRAGGLRGRRRIFDQAAVNFPRSDYRPSWLTGRAAPTPRSTRGPAPTPASSWCAPTTSTPITDASPACTSRCDVFALTGGAQPVSADAPPRACRRTRPRSGS